MLNSGVRFFLSFFTNISQSSTALVGTPRNSSFQRPQGHDIALWVNEASLGSALIWKNSCFARQSISQAAPSAMLWTKSKARTYKKGKAKRNFLPPHPLLDILHRDIDTLHPETNPDTQVGYIRIISESVEVVFFELAAKISQSIDLAQKLDRARRRVINYTNLLRGSLSSRIKPWSWSLCAHRWTQACLGMIIRRRRRRTFALESDLCRGWWLMRFEYRIYGWELFD